MNTRVKPPRVLLVDDCPDTRTIYRVHLQCSGFDVVEAANGLEGLHHAIEAAPDVILMDLSLPIMDGWEAIRRLKADPCTSEIPIVLMTCSTREDVAERAQTAGCDAFVSKPRRPSDLVNDVRKVLECVRQKAAVDVRPVPAFKSPADDVILAESVGSEPLRPVQCPKCRSTETSVFSNEPSKQDYLCHDCQHFWEAPRTPNDAEKPLPV